MNINIDNININIDNININIEGEKDHNQYWQEQVSSLESYLQVWYEDKVGQEGAAL